MSSAPDSTSITDLLFQSSLDGVLAFDLECRYTLWNPAMERMSGLPASQVVGRIAFEIFPFLKEIGEDRFFYSSIAGENATSEARPFKIPGTGKSGYFEGHYSSLRNAKGEVIGGMGIIRNITDRIEHETEQRFRALADQAPFAVQIYSPDGRCTYVNPAWEEFWNAKHSDLTSYNIFADPDVEKNGFTAFIARAFKGERITLPDLDYDRSQVTAGWRRRTIRTHFFPVHDASGTILEIALVLEDVTDTKSLEQSREDLASALENAKRAIEVRDSFLAIASHELRTPITLLKMQAERLRQMLSPDVSPKLTQIDNSLDRLVGVVEQMLNVARIQSGRLDIEREKFELPVLVSALIDQFKPQLETAGIEIKLEVTGDPTGYWDRHRLDQVVTNLLTNVIRYAPGAPVLIRIRRKNDTVFFEMYDGGPGIPRKDQERIFDRFERLATSKQAGGLGLGLHIAREIVNAHGGKIRAESPAGEGAAFIIELPIK